MQHLTGHMKVCVYSVSGTESLDYRRVNTRMRNTLKLIDQQQFQFTLKHLTSSYLRFTTLEV